LATKIGNTKISNSYRGKRFTVTPSDIRNGQPNDPCSCAAARALKREFNAKEVFVFRDVTYVVRQDGTALRYHTTPALRLETVIFDRKGQFFPGEYDIDPAPMTTKPKRSTSTSTATRGNSRNRPRRGIPNVRPTASQRLSEL
jgi:hypothetical protein